MIELDERDVRAIASSRFWHRNRRRAILVSLLISTIIVGAATLVDDAWYVPTVIAIVFVTFLGARRAMSKAEKRAVRDWKEASTRNGIEKAIASRHQD